MNKRRKREKEKTKNNLKEKEQNLENWIPKTELGKKVKAKEINSLDYIIENKLVVLEPEIIDFLLPNLEEELIEFNKTCKVTRSGRNYRFGAISIVGNKEGFIGIGTGKDKERWPAARKSVKEAKLNIKRIKRGCGSWECNCKNLHSIPFKVTGKSASVKVELLPAPKGTGLVVADSIKSVLILTGIKDIRSKTYGNSRKKINFIRATIDALNNINKMKKNKVN